MRRGPPGAVEANEPSPPPPTNMPAGAPKAGLGVLPLLRPAVCLGGWVGGWTDDWVGEESIFSSLSLSLPSHLRLFFFILFHAIHLPTHLPTHPPTLTCRALRFPGRHVLLVVHLDILLVGGWVSDSRIERRWRSVCLLSSHPLTRPKALPFVGRPPKGPLCLRLRMTNKASSTFTHPPTHPPTQRFDASQPKKGGL